MDCVSEETVFRTSDANPFTSTNWIHDIEVNRATITFSNFQFACLVEGTKITLANGTTKAVEDITYDDELLVYNFDEGKLDVAKPSWIMQEQTANMYFQSTFENGTVLNTVGNEVTKQAHRMFNADKNMFTYLNESVGDKAYTLNGLTKLVDYKSINKPCKFYNIITKKHFNLFANGMLTSNRFSNLYEIKDMKYIKQKKQIDMSNYEGFDQSIIEDFRLQEQQIDRNYIERLINLKK